ncbi:MAG: DNA-3-methyladenine glycosylase [Archangium sp.]|nr:DNA-3-methyladenine glycosylase [Archangium sp.]
MTPLPLSFSARSPKQLARALLGTLVVHAPRNQRPRIGRIVETEAYLGPHDLACHTSKGRTKRTEPMFGPHGHAYVYLVYGMHFCLNVVTGKGAAVLLRALEPVSKHLADCDGPAKLTKALGVTLAHNTLPLNRAPLFLAEGTKVPTKYVTVTTRIGVDYAKEWAQAPLRFYDSRSEWVSRR